MRRRHPGLTLPAAALLLTAAPLLTAAGVAGQATLAVPPDAGVRVDSLFSRWDSTTTPGCAVAVDRDGLTVLSEAYGMADLEHGIPNTPGTIFEGGSVSKQFTAATVVLLALQGALSLDDDVRVWVPELPDYGPTITLRHLLTHTSGLRDWGSVAALAGWDRSERSHTHDHALEIMAAQTALNFTPGHEYSYSNSGYTLLAIVAERASGTPLRELSRTLLFDPVGMHDTQWRDDYRRIVPGRSTAYRWRRGGWEIDRPIEHVYGNGGLLTTVGDLLLWNRALDARRFGEAFHREMHRMGVLNDGSEIRYASGLVHGDLGGIPSVTHTGATSGYRAFLGRYPDHGLSVAMLCNASNVSTGGRGNGIATVYLFEHMVETVAPEAAPVPLDVLRSYAGLYRDPVTGQPVEVEWEEGGLTTQGRPLIPLSATELWLDDERRVRVHPRDGGRPVLTLESWQFTDQRFDPVDAVHDVADPAEYVGRYRSAEADVRMEVRVQDGELVLIPRTGVTAGLAPTYADAFLFPGGVVRFVRDGATGAVTGLRIGSSRVYDLRLDRVAR